MSPSRANSSKRNLAGSFKPYTKGVAPTLIPSPSVVMLDSGPDSYTVAPTLSSTPGYTPVEPPGFPTYAQYKQVEAAYLCSLTPRRQGKALISQALFDRIWDVLHQPDSPGETAQFRFWARKMFTLSKTYHSTVGGENEGPQEVLLHDNLLVAIQEQLYDLLCYCHGSTGHGGRDKTCALIRKHYTWVPKDLVSSFIKACPTCIMKKCGGMDSAALATRMAEHRTENANVVAYGAKQGGPGSSTAGALMAGSAVAAGGVPWPHMNSSGVMSAHSKLDEADPIEVAYREAVLRARGLKATLAGIGNYRSHGMQGVPMLREVSLYKGLPNGWQYRHNEYAAAHAEFMKTKEHGVFQGGDLDVRVQRPRVPSILPLWGPDQFAQGDYSPSRDVDLGDASNTLSFAQQHQAQEIAPLQHTFMAHSQQPEKDIKEEPQQIGPILVQVPDEYQTPIKSEQAEVNLLCNTPTTLKRSTVPPRLQIDLAGSRSFQAFVAYRDSLTEGDTTPESPFIGMNWHLPSGSSPTNSDGSSCSSSFGMPPMSTATTISPPNSALQTPVDEFSSTNNHGSDGKNRDGAEGKMRVIDDPFQGEEMLSEGCMDFE